jgi:hypothetical protein
LLLLLFRHFEFVEHLAEDFERTVPIGFGDARAGMRRLHIASAVDARTAGRFADQIDDQLPDAHFAVGGEPDEEALLVLVAGETTNELVGDRGYGVIPAESLIERFFLGTSRAGEEAGRHRGNHTGSPDRGHGHPRWRCALRSTQIRAVPFGVSHSEVRQAGGMNCRTLPLRNS